jgi:hypothetical protein
MVIGLNLNGKEEKIMFNLKLQLPLMKWSLVLED